MDKSMVAEATQVICGNCRFFVRKQDKLGDCRESSPQAVVLPTQVPKIQSDQLILGKGVEMHVQMLVQGCFPGAMDDWWCGHFKERLI